MSLNPNQPHRPSRWRPGLPRHAKHAAALSASFFRSKLFKAVQSILKKKRILFLCFYPKSNEINPAKRKVRVPRHALKLKT